MQMCATTATKTPWKLPLAEHRRYIRRPGRVGEHRALQFFRGMAMPYCESEQVDDLIHMRAHQMRPQDLAGPFLDQDLIAIHRLRFLLSGEPVRRFVAADLELLILLAGFFLPQAHGSDGRKREGHTRDCAVVRLV